MTPNLGRFPCNSGVLKKHLQWSCEVNPSNDFPTATDTSVHVCEGDDLDIGCDDGYINIIEAVYGRLVNDICSYNSSVRFLLVSSYNCHSFKSMVETKLMF